MKHSKLIIWWANTLLVVTGVYWSYYFGIIHKIWESDITYITSIIAAIFIITNLYLGKLAITSYYIKDKIKFRRNLETSWFISEQLMALGMLGTVVGLVHMLAVNFVGSGNDMQLMLGDMWKAMGLALYTNAVGLIASITLKVQTYIVGHGVDEA